MCNTILPKKLPNAESIYGLAYTPTWEPEFSDSKSECHPVLLAKHSQTNQVDNSPRVIAKITELVQEFANKPGGILEIGVALYEEPLSFSYNIMKNKGVNTPYLGVDIEDRTKLQDVSQNIHILKSDSMCQNVVRKRMHEVGITSLKLLFIDGFHSLNNAVNDWKYANLVQKGGKVVIHDTNAWLGPYALRCAIDRNLFDVIHLFEEYEDDWGLTIATKK